MQALQHIKSISYLKSHAAQIAESLDMNGTPFIITQNGEASMVIEGIQQYQDKENLIAMLKVVAMGTGCGIVVTKFSKKKEMTFK